MNTKLISTMALSLLMITLAAAAHADDLAGTCVEAPAGNFQLLTNFDNPETGKVLRLTVGRSADDQPYHLSGALFQAQAPQFELIGSNTRSINTPPGTAGTSLWSGDFENKGEKISTGMNEVQFTQNFSSADGTTLSLRPKSRGIDEGFSLQLDNSTELLADFTRTTSDGGTLHMVCRLDKQLLARVTDANSIRNIVKKRKHPDGSWMQKIKIESDAMLGKDPAIQAPSNTISPGNVMKDVQKTGQLGS